jgi:FkbM family methyltransferase
MSERSVTERDLWQKKLALEADLVTNEFGPGKLSAYLETLEAIDRSSIGIVSFRWPSVTYPLYFRCGSSDLTSFKQVFISQDYSFLLPYEPRHILDLGAYVGYVSVYLAERFPESGIVSLEPIADNFRMLSLNTSAYSNIFRLNAAVWGASGHLRAAPHTAHDWGGQFQAAKDNDGGTKGLSIPDILEIVDWRAADFIKCDIEGAELSVFGESRESISSMAMACAVETHDAIAPGSSDTVAACFDPHYFARSRQGEIDLFLRLHIVQDSLQPARLSVLRPPVGTREISLKNVPSAPWGFYLFDENSCQLHPGQGAENHPEVSSVLEFRGQTTFDCKIGVQNPLGLAVRFILEIRRSADDHVVFQSQTSILAGELHRWTQRTPSLQGPHRVALRTAMAEPDATNHQAIANWFDPSFR